MGGALLLSGVKRLKHLEETNADAISSLLFSGPAVMQIVVGIIALCIALLQVVHLIRGIFSLL